MEEVWLGIASARKMSATEGVGSMASDKLLSIKVGPGLATAKGPMRCIYRPYTAFTKSEFCRIKKAV
jgi:hypothetical protein